MSLKLFCCLCCKDCSEYKLLENESGQSNEIYEMTVKYFDPMLITDNSDSTLLQSKKILCLDCWSHINDFHEFQLAVIKIRSVLQDTQVKLEEERDLEQSIHNELYAANKEELDNFEDDLFNSDLEDKYDLKSESPTASEESDDNNDNVGQFLQKPKTRKTTETKVNNNDKSNLTQKPKLLRGRKPKSSQNEASTPDKCEDVTETPFRKKKKLKDTEKPKTNNALEKIRKSDEFLAEWKPLLECELCSEAFVNFDLLRNHFKEKHNARCYLKCCERKFFRRANLIDHIRLHINPEMYKCDICGKVSSTKFNLKLHKKVVHEANEKFECDICHKTFAQKPYLDRHLLTHATGNKDFICPECGKGFILETLLKAHVKFVHNDDRVCDQCGKTLHGIQALKKHLMEHAGVEMPKYPCDECGAQLRTRNNLKRHKASCHNDGSTIYICSICDKVSSSENALKAHKRNVHEGKNKHKCTYCSKAFKNAKSLREHVATHTGQDLYQCPHCPQTFKVSANMHHHRKRMHPKEWLEARKDRLQLPKLDIKEVTTKVVI